MHFFTGGFSVRFLAEFFSVRPSAEAYPCVVWQLIFSCALS